MPLSFYATPILSSWEFDAADLSGQEIEAAGFGLLAPYGEKLSIPPALLRSFVKEVRERYLPNPYHNFLHALNVAQFVSMLDVEGLLERFDGGERFALLIAALCHDIGHPGTDNAFQRKYATQVVQKYGRESPLERMHADWTMQILQGLGWTGYFSLKWVDELIISTDMALHFEFLTQAEERKGDQELLGCLILKTADIGHLLRTETISDRWVSYLADEIALQKKLEGMMPPLQGDFQRQFRENQQAFVEKMAKPLFHLLASLLSKESDRKIERLIPP